MDITQYLDSLAREYLQVHTPKEDAFWSAYMGLESDAHAGRARLSERDVALQAFQTSPERLALVRKAVQEAEADLERADRAQATEDEFVALAGWLDYFSAHVIEDSQARELLAEIARLEGDLALSRSALVHRVPDGRGGLRTASSAELGVLVASDPDERVRRGAWECLRQVEQHVLEHGYLEIVKLKNRLGRRLGAEDWYDWKTQRVERITKREVFERLDELTALTHAGARSSLQALASQHGAQVLQPWNLRQAVTGDVTRRQDPYFSFANAIDTWMRSFERLGIGFHGARLVLDLVDRAGKHENGFMHGPEPAWVDRGVQRRARIQFTANAVPGLVGAGRRALETLFHEGGHAAHFAACAMPAPCFGQEYAPTSVAFSETQSMFCDSFLSDPAWQARYARTLSGERMSDAEIEAGLLAAQPLAAWNVRAMVAVCAGERAIHELADAELTPQRVLDELRRVERTHVLLDEGSPRPVLSVPHLLTMESSAYYHGYVLAEMAVEQTRATLEQRLGPLLDEPRVGATLRDTWWQHGNARSFFDYIEDLCGSSLSAQALARVVSRSPAQVSAETRHALQRVNEIPERTCSGELQAEIALMHGSELIAKGRNRAELAPAFRAWILERERLKERAAGE